MFSGMTKNPLALWAGVAIMLFGITMASYFGYQFFLEEKFYRSAAKSVTGTVMRKEKDEIFADPFEDLSKTKPTTETAAVSTAVKATESTTSTEATTTTTKPRDLIKTNYIIHYAFTPVDATAPVTGVYTTTKRLFEAMEKGNEVEVLYVPGKAEEDNRPLFPIKFGGSFYAGISVLFGGCLFIAYLGWCFIFPEDEPHAQSAAESKRAKREKASGSKKKGKKK